ncbi:MAG: AmmeMemoRadiSam system protein B, partial [Chloroflexi bacterium]|nr:AmmeMemoRadiSam system protein B [Chloroflexota bacterium]
MTNRTYTNVRHSPIAGQWYPGKADDLAQAVDKMLAGAHPSALPGDLVGLIVPHAGYPYSGPTAAHAYRLLRGRSIRRVILLGPSHYAYLGDYASPSEEAYETPLGLVPLDESFITRLAENVPLNRTRDDVEHSLEIQLPFLQRVLGDFHLVPIMLSTDSLPPCERLAGALADLIAGDRATLLIASSDQHHQHDYRDVEARDAVVREALATFDLPRISDVLTQPETTVCGRMPIITLLMTAQKLGANRVE